MIQYPVRILYVEDDKLLRDLIQAMLNDKSKYEVDVAEDGEEGIELNKKNNYDIIFMDIMMPKIDGVKTAYIIKQTHPNIPIMAVTALERYQIRNYNSEDFPIDYYLRKPVFSNVLKKTIDNIIKNDISKK